MTNLSQYFKTTFIARILATTILSVLICSPSSSSTKLNEKTQNHLDLEAIKTQLLEDTTFLSKLKKKIALHTDDHDIQNIVREYLLTNPEIMIQMQIILQEKLKKQKEKQVSLINLLKKEIFQSPHDAVFGNPNGKTELVVFFDYNCSHCKKSYTHITNLIKEYPDLRVIIKDLPILGDDSMAAHTVAYAFRQQLPEKYYQFYKELLTSPNRSNEAKAMKIATSLGANKKKLLHAMQDPNLQNYFQENIQIVSTLDITGTPSYIINNEIFVGAVSQEILKRSIENVQ
ncbi:thioredoxin domain-containing protein [Bartonella sp. B30(2025)]